MSLLYNLENAVTFCSHPEKEGVWALREEGNEKNNKLKRLNIPGLTYPKHYLSAAFE